MKIEDALDDMSRKFAAWSAGKKQRMTDTETAARQQLVERFALALASTERYAGIDPSVVIARAAAFADAALDPPPALRVVPPRGEQLCVACSLHRTLMQSTSEARCAHAEQQQAFEDLERPARPSPDVPDDEVAP